MSNEKNFNGYESEVLEEKRINLEKIKANLQEIKRRLSVKKLLIIAGLLITIGMGSVVSAEIIEANNNQGIYSSFINPTQTQYKLDEGIFMLSPDGIKNDLCVIRLAGEGLAALPDGCSWQMNFEGKLFLFNETNKTLVLVLKDELSKEEVNSIKELSIDESGNVEYRITPHEVSSFLAPSEILAAYFEE